MVGERGRNNLSNNDNLRLGQQERCNGVKGQSGEHVTSGGHIGHMLMQRATLFPPFPCPNHAELPRYNLIVRANMDVQQHEGRIGNEG